MSCLVVGNHTQGLGIVRSLGRNGVAVHLLYDKRICLSRFSKYLARFHRVMRGTLANIFDPANDAYLVQAMLAIVPAGKKWALFGVSEDIIDFFHRNRDTLKEKFFIPANDIYQIIDKYLFAKNCESVGVKSPKTFLLSEIVKSGLPEGTFVSKGRKGNKYRNLSNMKGIFLKDKQDLAKVFAYIGDKVSHDEVIIQEVIPSTASVTSCCGFAIHGELYATFMYKKIRQSPDQFGTGCYNRSIYNEVLLSQSEKIIKALNYTGPFELEYLEEDETGVFSVIEMNPRTWKCVDLATACGVNICMYYYEYMLEGKKPEKNFNFEVGKNWAHIGSDIPQMLLREKSLKFAYSNITFCDFDLNDIKPFLAQVFLAPLLIAKI